MMKKNKLTKLTEWADSLILKILKNAIRYYEYKKINAEIKEIKKVIMTGEFPYALKPHPKTMIDQDELNRDFEVKNG